MSGMLRLPEFLKCMQVKLQQSYGHTMSSLWKLLRDLRDDSLISVKIYSNSFFLAFF